MKSIFKFILICIFSLQFTGCGEKWLEEPYPTTIVDEDKVWNDETMIISLLADYYYRMPSNYNLASSNNMAQLDEACHSDGTYMDLSTYSWNTWALYDYTLIRDLNFALEGLEEYSTFLTPKKKAAYNAEFRFLKSMVIL